MENLHRFWRHGYMSCIGKHMRGFSPKMTALVSNGQISNQSRWSDLTSEVNNEPSGFKTHFFT